MLTQDQLDELKTIKWAHQIDLPGGFTTPGYYSHTTAHASGYFGLPEDLAGVSVLDVGCSDGMFSFEAERRGGLVTAMDTSRPEDQCIGKAGDWPRGFNFAKAALRSQVEFMDQDLYKLTPERQWDLVLFYGVLYHLTDPIEGLRRLASVTKRVALIETACSTGTGGPSWEFRPGEAGDSTNQWYPSLEGLERALHHVGFRFFEVVGRWEALNRATVRATK